MGKQARQNPSRWWYRGYRLQGMVRGVDVAGGDAESNANHGIQLATNALGTVNGMKRELFQYAAKIDPSIEQMKYVKGVKAMGKVFNIANAGMTAWACYSDIQEGHYVSASTRGIVWGIGIAAGVFIPGVGWVVAGSIGVADAIWGDDFYKWIETKFGQP